jgi:RimJ/RimL family protein N-acetyltransferase
MAETRNHVAHVTSVQLCRITCEVTENLTRLLERTYADALDVPGHSVSARADLQEHLKNSRSGVWWEVHHGENPIGLLLMGDAEQHQRSLLYFGLVPAARGKGKGRRALSVALRTLRGSSIQTVLTQVDASNEPALRCYAASGFFELSKAELLVCGG